jgi:hypothetical protein
MYQKIYKENYTAVTVYVTVKFIVYTVTFEKRVRKVIIELN